MPGCSRAAQFWPTLGDSRSRRYRAVVWHNDGLFRKRGCLLEVRGACALGNEREKWAAHTWTCLRDETGQNEALCTVGLGGEVERKARGAETGSEREGGSERYMCGESAPHTAESARTGRTGSAQRERTGSAAQICTGSAAQGAQSLCPPRPSGAHGGSYGCPQRSPGLSPQNLFERRHDVPCRCVRLRAHPRRIPGRGCRAIRLRPRPPKGGNGRLRYEVPRLPVHR